MVMRQSWSEVRAMILMFDAVVKAMHKSPISVVEDRNFRGVCGKLVVWNDPVRSCCGWYQSQVER